LAEREGFEPSVEVSPHTRLAGERLQPTRPSLRKMIQPLAEGVGFEPTELSLNGFQDRRLKPLGHPSLQDRNTYHFFFIGSIIFIELSEKAVIIESLTNDENLRFIILFKEKMMKHKYTISRDPEKGSLTLKEYGELDKEMMSFLCEASYNDEAVQTAIAKGKDALINVLRTENMYPPNLYADKIAESVIVVYDTENDTQSTEIIFDDLDWLTKDQEGYIIEDDSDDEDNEDDLDDDADENIDELLEDNFEDDFGDDDELKLDSPLKIADDDSADFEEES
jgi:hypothetical protein